MRPTIDRIEPDWMEEYDNPASFRVLLSSMPDGDEFVFDETNGQYIAVIGPVVRMFAYKRPGEGYGGAKFNLMMSNGLRRELIGPWSSGPSSSNSCYPSKICVDCSITADAAVMQRGHTFCGGHVLLRPLVEWWLDNRAVLDWGLYMMADGTVQPSRGRFVKLCGGGRQIARLFPGDGSQEYRSKHLEYFMGKALQFWTKQPATYGELSGAQDRAVNA